MFAALSQLVDTNRVKHARLVLQRMKPGRTCDSVSCTVTVDIEGSKPLRIQVSADHPYAAVNRAVERLSEGIQLEGCYAVDTTTLERGPKTEIVRELARRIEAEYVEMPGLSVTLPQAQRLWAAERHACQTASTG